MNAASENSERLLVVEDDTGLRELLAEELEDRGFATDAAADAETALALLQQRSYALVITDLRLPGLSGSDLQKRLEALPEPPACILITAFGTVAQAVDALKAGADDFLTKPVDLDHLLLRIRRVLSARSLRSEMARLRRDLDGERHFHGLIGDSPPMRRLYRLVSRVARTDSPVLVVGESGSGKELVARAVHAESERAQFPFVPINCAGVPQDLMESEFFGHAAGAFTGAGRARQGLFAAADGGTLFLDEIAEMPLALQAKLLRVLQDGRVRPVGADGEIALDVRVVAATNRDPAEAVRDKRLREDLYYRLEGLTLTVPPLRERGEDLELLVGRMLARICARQGKAPMGVSEDALECLERYAFPGNVRELINALERAVTFCTGDTVRASHLPARIRAGEPVDAGEVTTPGQLPDPSSRLPTLREVEDGYIRRVLERVNGNKREAARILGIGRRTLYRRLESGEPGTG